MESKELQFWYGEIERRLDLGIGLGDKILIKNYLNLFEPESEKLSIFYSLVYFLNERGYETKKLNNFKKIYDYYTFN